MRLAVFLSVLVIVTSPVFAQEDGGPLPDAPQSSRQRAANWFLGKFNRIAAKPVVPRENVPDQGRSEAQLRRRIDQTQKQLKREEQRLKSELERFDKMREAAIKKADLKAIKNVEELQQKAIDGYEKRIERLLSDGHHDRASRNGVVMPKEKDKQPRKREAPPKKPKRRLRLWPFS